ncbi:beta-ketoacyl-[acyl-carrier-protein] synthase family protein [Micromonospora tarensis]|uniref:Beta-ketoacyl synthase n=1 Tax=Micromonospora tarensis TaxID=2806100 RepID=A0ABS1YKR0_9ACTN|nr:beta-ketoacyl synthase N-terminal-like domain-containing protein [Micromonospora tarensis]MBM0278027.1 beta-ketoacyl synthase [Micromonospora tarensis]
MSAVIAGAGAVSSVGRSVDDIFTSLCGGRSGVGDLRVFDRTRYRAEHAYEMDDRPPGGPDVPLRTTRWLLAAIEQAARSGGLGDDLEGVPVLVGTGLRELRSVELRHRGAADIGPADLHFGPAVRERFGATEIHTLANACAASLSALALGADLLDAGEADAVVVAGTDMITESMFGLVERVSAVPPDRVRPFDRDRLGAVMGEGACAVVLRRSADARPALGVLRGVGINCDAYHVTAPSPAGMAAAMRQAYQRADRSPTETDLVMLHGTGTMLNDEAEATALTEVFGDRAGRPLMTAIKSMTGHTSGASGLLGLIVALRSLHTGAVPPTLGLENPVPEAAPLRIVTELVEGPSLSTAQINAFGFGGINAVAIVERAR